MSENKFTPGPWTVEQQDWADGYGFWWQIMAREAKVRVCELADTGLPEVAWQRNGMGEIPPAENLMNAHLIAAAPEMYEALKDLTGRFEILLSMKYFGNSPDVIKASLAEARAALAKAEGRVGPQGEKPRCRSLSTTDTSEGGHS